MAFRSSKRRDSEKKNEKRGKGTGKRGEGRRQKGEEKQEGDNRRSGVKNLTEDKVERGLMKEGRR